MKLPKLLRKIRMVLGKTEEIFLCVATIILAFILIVNAIARKAGVSIYVIDEMAMILVIWITFVGLGYATRKARHIRMEAIFDSSSERIKKILILVISTISAVAMFYMGNFSIHYLYSMYRWEQVTVSMRIPYWIVLIVLPVGFYLSSIHFVFTIIKNVQEKKDVWLSYEQKDEYHDEYNIGLHEI